MLTNCQWHRKVQWGSVYTQLLTTYDIGDKKANRAQKFKNLIYFLLKKCLKNTFVSVFQSQYLKFCRDAAVNNLRGKIFVTCLLAPNSKWTNGNIQKYYRMFEFRIYNKCVQLVLIFFHDGLDLLVAVLELFHCDVHRLVTFNFFSWFMNCNFANEDFMQLRCCLFWAENEMEMR